MKFIAVVIFGLLDIVSAAPLNSSITTSDEKQGRGNKVKRQFDVMSLLFEELGEMYNNYFASNEGTNDDAKLMPITSHVFDINRAEQVPIVPVTGVSNTTVSGTVGKRRTGASFKKRNPAHEASYRATIAHEAALLATAAKAEVDEAVKIAITAFHARISAIDDAIAARAHAKDAENSMNEAFLSRSIDMAKYDDAVAAFKTAKSLAEEANEAALVAEKTHESAEYRGYVASYNAMDAEYRARITAELADEAAIYAKAHATKTSVDSE